MLCDNLKKAHPGLRPSDLDYIERLWSQFRQYADRQFEVEFIADLQGRFWEMYLGCALLDAGHALVPADDRPAEGPDICVQMKDTRIWIEAIAPGRGQGADAVPESPADGKARYVPDNELMLRYRSAFFDKQKIFCGYRHKNIVEAGDITVIAISGGRFVGQVWAEMFLPRIVHCLYPIGHYAVTLDRDTLEVVHEGHTYRDCIKKQSGVDIETDVFLNADNSDISAVIFSYADACNHPDRPGADFVTCHHVKPRAALPLGWIARGREFWVEGNDLRCRDMQIEPMA